MPSFNLCLNQRRLLNLILHFLYFRIILHGTLTIKIIIFNLFKPNNPYISLSNMRLSRIWKNGLSLSKLRALFLLLLSRLFLLLCWASQKLHPNPRLRGRNLSNVQFIIRSFNLFYLKMTFRLRCIRTTHRVHFFHMKTGGIIS